MTSKELTTFVKTVPSKAGVYLFKRKNVPIYIGKAAALKARLGSYLKTEDPRILKMISVATKVDYIPTDSEIEALILESQFIKQKRPQFNIMLRDDKQYFYVAFTNDQFPRIFLTHQPQSAGNRTLEPSSGRDRGNRRDWFPKAGRKSMFPADFIGPFTEGSALKSTLRLLRGLFPYCTCTQKHHNYCLNYHIGKCPGVCCLKQPDTISNFQFLISNYKQNIKSIRNILNGKRTSVTKELTREMDQLARTGKLEEAISLRAKIGKLERIFENAKIIKNSEILKDNQPFLSSLFHNSKPIVRVEGYDISNIQGKHATGSMVTFVNGEADKNFYRKFNIPPKFAKANLSGHAGIGDTQMLQHILERRLNHEEWPYPDLIVVDGGKAQVNTFRSVLQEQNIKIPVVGLVKDERHVGTALIVPDKKEAVPLAKLSERDRNLLLAIDSEAHRFAIAHYRKVHRKKFLV